MRRWGKKYLICRLSFFSWCISWGEATDESGKEEEAYPVKQSSFVISSFIKGKNQRELVKKTRKWVSQGRLKDLCVIVWELFLLLVSIELALTILILVQTSLPELITRFSHQESVKGTNISEGKQWTVSPWINLKLPQWKGEGRTLVDSERESALYFLTHTITTTTKNAPEVRENEDPTIKYHSHTQSCVV